MFRNKKKLANKGITIREDLTKTRLQLYKAAIDHFGMKDVWTSDGVVVVKKEDTRIRLKSFRDLQTVSN